MPLTPSPLLADAGVEFAETIERFARERLDADDLGTRDADGGFWRDGWKRCAAVGLCGLPVPEPLGGSGADRPTVAAALEALGYGCADGGLVFSLSAHLWSAVVPVWQHGTAEQQARYLGPLCRGELIGLHAMTEPETGSDAFGLRTVARPDDDGFRISGRKCLITNAPVADVFIVFARAPGTEGALGVSAYLIDAGTDGLHVEPPTEKLGLRTSPMAEIVLDEVAVGPDRRLGKPGRGAKVFGTSMLWERSLIMAGALGALGRALDDACDYARKRTQFGSAIGTFGPVSDRLANVRTRLDAARALLYETALRHEQSGPDVASAAAAKLFATEVVVDGALDLMRVHGGHGFTRALPIERVLRDALGALAYSGTSDMMRRLVVRGMGL